MAQIEIDGRALEVGDGKMIIEAADELGIYIPRFCYHKKLSIAANCRMCLVHIEKAAKPLPACATPISDGMRIHTKSDIAVKAQKGVMEFLLINHPLDCPICDQGGECQLQDLAVGFGGSNSRYTELKRVVPNKDLGPLIATDMTRCIHCTRCVRFGQEIGGMMELGMTGRSEFAEIGTYVARTVNSELSGNMIDLCPVGALTSKPFRYTARPWELSRRASISPHCGLGTNLIVQVKQNRVMRVLPRENEEINECWLSDKDRFSYEGLNSEARLTKPMIKQNGEWQECDWQVALEYVAHGLKDIREQHGAEAIGALASPHSTLEELYVLQKLMREMGSGNIDHRLRQSDFSGDDATCGVPWLGMEIEELESLDRILIIGSNLRQDHPLLAHRFRVAVKAGAELCLVNFSDDNLLTRVTHAIIVGPAGMPEVLHQIHAGLNQGNLEKATADVTRAIAKSLAQGEKVGVFLGNQAQHHPQFALLHLAAQEIAVACKGRLGFLGEAANSVGAYVAGAVPMTGPLAVPAKTGMNVARMLSEPRRAYVLLGVEAELDTYNSYAAVAAMYAADMIVAMSAYRHQALEYADVLLPIAPFTETSGSFINTSGSLQSFNAVVKPLKETRPAWKVMRVLGNLLGLNGFNYDSTEEIRNELLPTADATRSFYNNQTKASAPSPAPQAGPVLRRIGEVPMYYADPIVRRAESLQHTQHAATLTASMHSSLLHRLGAAAGARVVLRQDAGSATVTAAVDDTLPADCVRIPGSHPATVGLGDLFGEISVELAQ